MTLTREQILSKISKATINKQFYLDDANTERENILKLVELYPKDISLEDFRFLENGGFDLHSCNRSIEFRKGVIRSRYSSTCSSRSSCFFRQHRKRFRYSYGVFFRIVERIS